MFSTAAFIPKNLLTIPVAAEQFQLGTALAVPSRSVQNLKNSPANMVDFCPFATPIQLPVIVSFGAMRRFDFVFRLSVQDRPGDAARSAVRTRKTISNGE